MSGRGATVGQPILAAAAFQSPLNRRAVLPHACLLLTLLLAPAAHAQFNLFLVEGSTERAAPAVYDFGSLYSGESASAHLRVRNTSSAPATLTILEVAGVGFTLTSPTLPVGLAPQGALDLTVVFTRSILELIARHCIPTASPSCSPRPSRRASPTRWMGPERRFPARWISAA